MIETLSVGYYNYYIKKYSEELQNEFQDEEPCDKYSLYKKLTKVRRTVDKKYLFFHLELRALVISQETPSSKNTRKNSRKK